MITRQPEMPASLRIPDSMRVSARLKSLSNSTVSDKQIAPIAEHELSTAIVSNTQTSPLRRFAQAIVESADQKGQTPIVVPGLRVVLHAEFFVALSSEVIDIAKRSVRIEAMSPTACGWTSFAMLRGSRRLVNQLAAAVPHGVELVETNRISRPAGLSRPLLVGIAASSRMMQWLPIESCYRIMLLETDMRTPMPAGTQATIDRYHLESIPKSFAKKTDTDIASDN